MTPENALFHQVLWLFPRFEDLIFTTALGSLRIMACFLVLPAMGEQFVQGYIRNGLVFIVGVFVAFGQPSGLAEHLTALEWLGHIGKEAMIGMLMGFAASTVFWTAESVGAYIDTQTGYNSVQMTNPLSGEQSTPVSSFLLQMIVSVFYVLGGMVVLIGALFESYHIWPLFKMMPEVSRLPELFIINHTEVMMTTVIKFAAPVLLVLMLIDLGIGLITRAADKLEPTGLSQPIKGAVAMLMLALLAGTMVTQVRHLLLPTNILKQVQSTVEQKK